MAERPRNPRRKPETAGTGSAQRGGTRSTGGRKPAARSPKAPAEPAVQTLVQPEQDAQPPIAQVPESPPAISERRRRLYRVPVLGALVYLIAPPLRRKPSAVRRSISAASVLVALLGVGMLFYPVGGHRYPGFVRIPVEKGIEWSNVLSDLESNRIQGRLNAAFERKQIAVAPVPAREGEPVTRLRIPKLGVDSIVVEGTSASALKAGAGHYPQTPLPGQAGNVAIAGHRTTYGRPFNRIDELRPGDQIALTTPVGTFTYEVDRSPWITHPTDWSVVDQSSAAQLTLTSCNPKGSAKQRIVVRAKLVRSEPAARAKRAA